MTLRTLVVAALSLLAGCSPPAPQGARTATLVYSSNVDGDIEPCG